MDSGNLAPATVTRRGPQHLTSFPKKTDGDRFRVNVGKAGTNVSQGHSAEGSRTRFRPRVVAAL